MEPAEAFLKRLRAYHGRPLRIMEVCGTHTAENFRLGIRSLLPESIRLISGPGCPVCVTPVGYIDAALEIAKKPETVLCSFGDLLRVPGTGISGAGVRSLARARAEGADVRVVYSPLDAVRLARREPEKQFVFLAVGFETTTPAACLAVRAAQRSGLRNFSLLTSNRTMENAYRLLRGSADAYLYPGHVSVMTGTAVYERLAAEGVSGVVTGFTAGEILAALAVIVERLQAGKPFWENCYPRVVAPEGNPEANALVTSLMEPCDAEWRGLGTIPGSGLRLREEYAEYDASRRFGVPVLRGRENAACRCGAVLRGDCEPTGCPQFGKACTPENPLGACMVSAEGACAAFYQYGRLGDTGGAV